MTRQPALSRVLVTAAQDAVTSLGVARQDAAVLVHAGAIAQHAVQVGLAPEGDFRTVLDTVASLHPGLATLADLPAIPAGGDRVIADLWKNHQLFDLDDNVEWWSYPLGDLYQTLSVESRKGRALCQTPWWVGQLLLHVSYDRAQGLWKHPQVIDPACGTGHLLVEAFHRAQQSHRFYDGYSAVNPYLRHTPTLEDALDRVHGVDLDAYAALIARYRLLVLAWSQLRHSHDVGALADLPLHVAAADSLLADDEPLLESGRYHVVVGNPPYVTVKDPVVNESIRARYPEVCSGKYSLALPFHALMMRLLAPGGWCAQLTANSFMKREFGKRYVEQWLPQFDAQWVIDTSGAYIPGHGTPTVILVHRNQPATSEKVHAVFGIRGEPKQPEEPSKGLVWSAIADAVYRRESAERFARGAEAAWLADHPEQEEPTPVAEIAPAKPAEAPVQPSLFDLLHEAA